MGVSRVSKSAHAGVHCMASTSLMTARLRDPVNSICPNAESMRKLYHNREDAQGQYAKAFLRNRPLTIEPGDRSQSSGPAAFAALTTLYTVHMDVYDFDGTLYRGDSTADFLRHCIRRHPRAALTLPLTGIAAVACFGMRVIDKTRFKGVLYRLLRYVPAIDEEIARFWRANEERIAGPCRPRPGDVVISASPEFLLRGVCEKRGLILIASQVDPVTGLVLGPNCSNDEKTARFRSAFPGAEIERFYSDSHDDDPLASIAKQAYFVRGDELVPWERAL